MKTPILIVEDSPTQSMLLSRLLEQAGYLVSASCDGASALEHLAENEPALVITDVTMPGMNGYQLCRAIRAGASHRDMPLLLLTSLANQEELILGLESGADAFVSKPYDGERLLARVAELLANGGSIAEGPAGPAIEILVSGSVRTITASRGRILRYLVSTYDSALQANGRLSESEAKLQDMNAALEERVQARTAALTEEMAQRKLAQDEVQATNALLEIANRNVDEAGLLREFGGEVARFSGRPDVGIVLCGPEKRATPRGQEPPETGVSVRLGERYYGYIRLGGPPLSARAAAILEAAASQLAAAVQRIGAARVLGESEERYRRFFEDVPSGALIAGPDGTIRGCNPAFAAMFGLKDAGDMAGMNASAMYRDPEAWKSFAEELKRDGRISGREMELLGPGGGSVHAIVSAVGEFDADGSLSELRQYLVDVTDRKNLERQLSQAQKMEAIGRLAGGVAHDFNNILQVIQGFADILASKTPEDDPRKKWIGQIQKATDKAAALVQSLLTFSRKQKRNDETLDLNELLNDIRPMLAQLLGTGVALDLALSDGIGEIVADRSQFDQVIMNLAANARDAMAGAGTLLVSTANASVESAAKGAGPESPASGDYILLTVRDTGSGMPAEVMEHMFEPFFTTKETGKGTGLGLATVYGAVKQSGGYLRCDSEPGRGTAFFIYYPIAARVPA